MVADIQICNHYIFIFDQLVVNSQILGNRVCDCGACICHGSVHRAAKVLCADNDCKADQGEDEHILSR